MHRDYVGLVLMLLRLAMAPHAMFGNSDIRREDEAGRNLINSITGTIVKSDHLLFLAEEGCIRTDSTVRCVTQVGSGADKSPGPLSFVPRLQLVGLWNPLPWRCTDGR